MALRKEDQGLESEELEKKAPVQALSVAGQGNQSQCTEGTEAGKASGKAAGRNMAGEGTAQLTVLDARGKPAPARTPSHGKGMLKVGNDINNDRGGAPKKLTRESLTDAAGAAAESYRELRDKWLELAKQALESGDTGEADRCQKAADRIQGAYLQYGVGSKVTHVIDKPEWVAQTGRAFDWAADSLGIDPQDAARLRKLMFKRIDESLE